MISLARVAGAGGGAAEVWDPPLPHAAAPSDIAAAAGIAAQRIMFMTSPELVPRPGTFAFLRSCLPVGRRLKDRLGEKAQEPARRKIVALIERRRIDAPFRRDRHDGFFADEVEGVPVAVQVCRPQQVPLCADRLALVEADLA